MTLDTDETRKRYSDWVVEHDENPPATHRLHFTIEVEMTVAVPPWLDPNDMLAAATVPGDIPYRIFESWSYADPPVHIHDDKLIAWQARIQEL